MLDRYDQDLLLDYLEDELDEGRRAQLDAMLAEDPHLAALLSEMAKDRAALRSMPQAEAPGDLVHDVTRAMERRMLLDDTVEDAGPIPLSRGRGVAAEATRSISWGRVIGLTGLAASVALVAGILVITFDDPLERTAHELADNTPAQAEEAIAESATTDEASDIAASLEALAALDKPDRTNELPTPAVATPPTDSLANTIDGPLDEALALARNAADDLRNTTPGLPATTTPRGRSSSGDQPAETLAFNSAAAISVIQPQQKLVLFSESPEASLEQLFEFCIANGIAVVQPEQMRFQRDAVKQLGSDAQPATPEEPGITSNDDVASADYALLINEAQLNTLVQSLNNDITIKPERAGKASLISNQAAMLTDLPDHTYPYRAEDKSRDLLAGDGAVENAPQDALEQADFAHPQQAVQLRSPDLGSAYANTRNAYNLQVQQRASYDQPATPSAEPTADRAAAKQHAGVIAPQPQAELSLPDTAVPKSEENKKLTDQANGALQGAKDDDAFELDRSNNDTQQRRQHIDPTRGNWLSAHLPLADTTPLLLSWREGQVDRPTKLVPVMIQRAEPDKVNTLRARQQIEFANRLNQSANTKAKASEVTADEAADSEATEADAVEEAAPTESNKPAESAESIE